MYAGHPHTQKRRFLEASHQFCTRGTSRRQPGYDPPPPGSERFPAGLHPGCYPLPPGGAAERHHKRPPSPGCSPIEARLDSSRTRLQDSSSPAAERELPRLQTGRARGSRAEGAPRRQAERTTPFPGGAGELKGQSRDPARAESRTTKPPRKTSAAAIRQPALVRRGRAGSPTDKELRAVLTRPRRPGTAPEVHRAHTSPVIENRGKTSSGKG